jgi:hypothetical protein
MTPVLFALSLLLTAPAAAGDAVAVRVKCRLRSAPTTESKVLAEAAPGSLYPVQEVSPQGRWVRAEVGGVTGWLGPSCEWQAVGWSPPGVPTSPPPPPPEAPPPPPAVEEPAPPPPVVDRPAMATPAPAEPSRPSYGGVFLGGGVSPDPFLREGGRLSVGGVSLLRKSDSPMMIGFSAAILGGARFQRVVTPYIPRLGGTGGFDQAEGIGNVASIYTDVMHVPIASYVGWGWAVGPIEFVAAAGPSAHRVSVSRFEQVTGVERRTAPPDGDAQGDQSTLTTYTLDRRFSGASRRWGAGMAALGAVVFDAGKMPIVEGEWSLALLGMAASPLGRQGCQGLSEGVDAGFGTLCVPLDYAQVRRTYYTQGKEYFDEGIGSNGALLLPVQALSLSGNLALLFQF